MRKQVSVMLTLLALLILTLPVRADYTLPDGTSVKWAGGDMISINGGSPVKGVRVGDRLLPPSDALPNVRVDIGSSGGTKTPYQDLGATQKQSNLAVIAVMNPDGTITVGTADIWGNGYSSVLENSYLGRALQAAGAPIINGQVAVSYTPGGAACSQTGRCQGNAQASYTPWDMPTSNGHTITIRLPYGGDRGESGSSGGTITTTPVNITGLTVSPDPSTEGDTITVTATSDTPADSVQVGFDWPSGNQAINLSQAGNNLTWRGTVTVPAGSAGTRTASAMAQNSASVTYRSQTFTVLPPDSRGITGALDQPVARAGMVLNVSVTVNGTVADPNDPPSVVTPWGQTLPLAQGTDGVWRASAPIPATFGGGSYTVKFQARLTQPPAYMTPKLVSSEVFVTIMAQADRPPEQAPGSGGQQNDIPDWWTPPQYGGTGGW